MSYLFYTLVLKPAGFALWCHTEETSRLPLSFLCYLSGGWCPKSHGSLQELSTALEKQGKAPVSRDQPRRTTTRAVQAFTGAVGAKRSVPEHPWLQLLPQVVSGLFGHDHHPRGFVRSTHGTGQPSSPCHLQYLQRSTLRDLLGDGAGVLSPQPGSSPP